MILFKSTRLFDMSFFKHNDTVDILLYSDIEYSDEVVYLSFDFEKNGKFTFKSTNILSVTSTSIYFRIDEKHESIFLDEKSKRQIQQLQFFFKKATDFELSSNRKKLYFIKT